MKNFIDFQHKTFLITGATSGIGFEICKQIDSYNGTIVAIGRNQQKLEHLQNSLENKENFVGLVFDLEQLDTINELLEKLTFSFDGIVHAAGIVKLAPIKFYKQENQDQIRKVNYDSIVTIISYLFKTKKINNSASIVFISSIAGSFGMKGNLMYSSTKASLDIFAKVLASEVSNLKIRVNTICPGQVETPLTAAISETISSEAIEIDKKKYPLGYGTPEDVANLTLFLLSDKSKWMTGVNIPIDGGRTTIL
jgi:NAD(P)-dependent dehydrogenase (short-subunit alcohol dehydrogenase family)